MSFDHKAPRHVVFSTPLLLSQSWALISTWALYSRTPSAYVSPSERETNFHSIQNNRKKYSSSILLFALLESKLENKRFCTEWEQAFPAFSHLLNSSRLEFWFLRALSKYLNCSAILKDLLPIFALWFCRALPSRHVTVYWVFSAYIDSSIRVYR